jgi:hypothetical protein
MTDLVQGRRSSVSVEPTISEGVVILGVAAALVVRLWQTIRQSRETSNKFQLMAL